MATREIDSILKQSARKRGRKKFDFSKFRLIFWILLILVYGFFFAGKALSDYAFKHLKPLSFFREGKYLVLFQNNAELRASGGFIGSFAVIEVKNYQLQEIKFNTNIYKLDSAFLDKNYVPAPKPLAQFLKGQSWTLRDSNYDVSFPDAATDIEDLYQKETGEKLDGVVATNAGLITDFLKLTGPVKMVQYNVELSAENFYQATTNEVEKKYYDKPENWLVNEPKSILKDLFPVLAKKVLAENKIKLVTLFFNELVQKRIMFYFNDPVIEKEVLAKNWGGQITLAEGSDYLSVFVDNYSANKSSLSVTQKVEYTVQEGKKAELVITRKHEGVESWPEGPNESYLRVLVPKDTKLKDATLDEQSFTKVDLTSEAGKTVWGMPIRVAPSQTTVLHLKYELPQRIDPYKITVQKQSGSPDDFWKIVSGDKVIFQGVLTKDLSLN